MNDFINDIILFERDIEYYLIKNQIRLKTITKKDKNTL